MQIFFLIIIGLYSALVLFRFTYNMWKMLKLDANDYNIIQLQHFTRTGKMYAVDHNEYASVHMSAYAKYFGVRFVILSVLVWLVIRFV